MPGISPGEIRFWKSAPDDLLYRCPGDAAILVGIQPGDEVIMPSFTFVSTANAFVLRGAKIIFAFLYAQLENLGDI